MKHSLICALVLFSIHGWCMCVAWGGQEQAKPVYRIEARREGSVIGNITIELFPLIAPKAVQYFDSLVNIKFYDSTAFHRVIPGFMIQGGDPNSRSGARETWGYGNPNQEPVEAEFSKISYVRGILGAARDDNPNSATSQFFICVATASHLNGNYTVYGKAVDGMNIADSIVRSPRDGKDNPFSKIEMFITKIGMNDSIPSAPLLKSPANAAPKQTSSTALSWQAVPGAVLYHVEVARDSAFSSIVFSDASGSTGITVSGLELGLNTYYWRVRANNGGHLSSYSETRSFTTYIASPKLAYPDSASISPDTTLRLGWNSVKGAVAYHIQVATNILFSPQVMVFENKEYPDTSVLISNLPRGKRYFWRVSALTSEYEGGYSPTRPFEVQGVVSVQEASTSCTRDIEIHPLPLSSTAEVRYYLSKAGVVRIRMLNVQGKELMQLADIGYQQEGEQYYTVDVSSLENGVYIIEIQNSADLLPQQKLLLLQH